MKVGVQIACRIEEGSFTVMNFARSCDKPAIAEFTVKHGNMCKESGLGSLTAS